ncbi:unnamed protein product, partial [Prorocentrum cordatum]
GFEKLDGPQSVERSREVATRFKSALFEVGGAKIGSQAVDFADELDPAMEDTAIKIGKTKVFVNSKAGSLLERRRIFYGHRKREIEAASIEGLRAAVQSRKIEALEEFINKCEDLELVPREVASAREVLEVERRKAECRVALAEACEARDGQLLDSALGLAAELGLEGAEVAAAKVARATLRLEAALRDGGVEALRAAAAEAEASGVDGADPVLREVRRQVDEQARKEAARRGIEQAARTLDAAVLEAALAEGRAAGLEEEELGAAQHLLEEERRRAAARAALAAAAAGRAESALEAALAEGEAAGLGEGCPELQAARGALAEERAGRARAQLREAEAGGGAEELRAAIAFGEAAGLGAPELGAPRALAQLVEALAEGGQGPLRAAVAAALAAGVEHARLEGAKALLASQEQREEALASLAEGLAARSPARLREGIARGEALGLGEPQLAAARAALREEEQKAETIAALEEATAARDLEALRCAVAAAGEARAGAEPGLGLDVRPALEGARRVLEEEELARAAREELDRALAEGSPASLQAALEAGEAAGLPPEDLRSARAALVLLEAKAACAESLREAARQEDEAALRAAIAKATELGLDGKDLEAAQRALQQVELRRACLQRLQEALQQQCTAGVRAAVAACRAAGVGEARLQRKSLYDQLEVAKKKLLSAQQTCDKTCEAMVTLANDYTNQCKLVADLSAETQQLETQHKMAVEQALKEHVSTSAPSLETYIISQFPPGLAPSTEVKQAAVQLSAKLHDEWQAAQATQASSQQAQTATQGAADSQTGTEAGAAVPIAADADPRAPSQATATPSGDVSPELAASLDAEAEAMQLDHDEADKRSQGMKRVGEAIDQVLNINGQNSALTPQQQMANAALQSSAKALCLAKRARAARGRTGRRVGNTVRSATINGSCWRSIRKFLKSQAAETVDIICCQELRVLKDALPFIAQWCEREGWNAILPPAALSEKGHPVQGAGSLIRDGHDYGVSRAPLPAGVVESRRTAVSLELPGHRPFVLVSFYLADGVGLHQYNLELVAGVAMIQDAVRQPLIIAGDFNVSTSKLIESNYRLRAGPKILASTKPTCKMKKSESIIDFVLAPSHSDQDLSRAAVLNEYPMSPRRPALFQLRCGMPYMAPVLEKPQPFATSRPYGPTNHVPPWDRAEAALDFLDQVIDRESGIEARLLALDSAYQYFASDMAKTISIGTDTPIKSPTDLSGFDRLFGGSWQYSFLAGYLAVRDELLSQPSELAFEVMRLGLQSEGPGALDAKFGEAACLCTEAAGRQFARRVEKEWHGADGTILDELCRELRACSVSLSGTAAGSRAPDARLLYRYCAELKSLYGASLADERLSQFPLALLCMLLYTQHDVDVDRLLLFQDCPPACESPGGRGAAYGAYRERHRSRRSGDRNEAVCAAAALSATLGEEGSPPARWIKLSCLLSAARIPLSPPRQVSRWLCGLPAHLVAELGQRRPGERLCWAQLGSCTLDGAIAEGYWSAAGPEEGVLLTVEGVTEGLELAALSQYPAERELVLPACSLLRVRQATAPDGRPPHLRCEYAGTLLSDELQEACWYDLAKASFGLQLVLDEVRPSKGPPARRRPRRRRRGSPRARRAPGSLGSCRRRRRRPA